MRHKDKAMPADRALGARIKQLRQQQGWSQTEFGRRIGGGTTHQKVERYETGADRVAAPVLERIAEVFDMPIQKSEIRKIIKLRKLEQEKGEDYQELLAELYLESLPIEF